MPDVRSRGHRRRGLPGADTRCHLSDVAMRWTPVRTACICSVVDYRPATERDAEAIAALHAESWRTNYRGAYSDRFLDGDVYEDRWAVWSELLREIDRSHDTVVAEDARVIIGFAHTVLDQDPVWVLSWTTCMLPTR